MLPQGGALQNDASIDRKPEGIVVKQDESHEGIPQQAGNKVIAGRELLSEENKPREDVLKESVVNDQLNADGSKGNELPNKTPVPDADNFAPQDSFMQQNGQQSVRTGNIRPRFPNPNVRKQPIVQHVNPHDVKVPIAQNNGAGRRAMPMDQRWLQMQQQMRHAAANTQDESNEEVVRRPRDVDSQLADGEIDEEGVQVLEFSKNYENTEREESMLTDNTGRENEGIDTELEMKLSENAKELQQEALMGDNREEPIEDVLPEAKEPANPPILSDTEKQQRNDVAEEPGLDIENADQDEHFEVMNTHNSEGRDEKELVLDCLENDFECWQSKSKLRELKSLDLN